MKEENQQSMQKWRVGRRRHIKGRWRWYDNSCDSDSYNSTITIGGDEEKKRIWLK